MKPKMKSVTLAGWRTRITESTFLLAEDARQWYSKDANLKAATTADLIAGFLIDELSRRGLCSKDARGKTLQAAVEASGEARAATPESVICKAVINAYERGGQYAATLDALKVQVRNRRKSNE